MTRDISIRIFSLLALLSQARGVSAFHLESDDLGLQQVGRRLELEASAKAMSRQAESTIQNLLGLPVAADPGYAAGESFSQNSIINFALASSWIPQVPGVGPIAPVGASWPVGSGRVASPAMTPPGPHGHAQQPKVWDKQESANFRIFHKNHPDMAQKALHIAEQTRQKVREKYLGPDAPDICANVKCEIYVYETGAEYNQATGESAASAGHSKVETDEADASQIHSRRIDLRGDHRNMLSAVLPHEVTHTTLSGYFGKKPIPPWADEGMAVLSEPTDQVAAHLRALPETYKKGQVFTARRLMGLKKYPEPEFMGLFYAQSTSLVQYLSEHKGPKTFAQFLRESQEEGYEKALQKHYGVNFDQLENHWADYAKAGSKSQKADALSLGSVTIHPSSADGIKIMLPNGGSRILPRPQSATVKIYPGADGDHAIVAFYGPKDKFVEGYIIKSDGQISKIPNYLRD